MIYIIFVISFFSCLDRRLLTSPFLKYAGIAFVNNQCGYACSDHASASRNGFPSAYVHETDGDHDNPHIHTPQDTIEKLNFDHMMKHGKLITGWLYELAFARL